MRTLLSGPAALLAAAAALGAPSQEYRFTTVKSKVVVVHDGVSRRAAAGDAAPGGDRVETGWFGRAELDVRAAASRFVLYPSTVVELGAERPEVLLVLRKGKLEAAFDALLGRDERLVETPGAVLAVRGTRYGVEVARDGEAVLAVFEGRVEVRPRDPSLPPVSVGPGHLCRFGPQRPPQVGRAPAGFDASAWQRAGAMRQPAAGDGAPGDRSPGGQPGSGPGGQTPRGHGKGGG